MRFPSFEELDTVQKDIFTDLNLDKNILVVGPPGTGKTLVAYHKALKLDELGKKVQLIICI